MVELLRKPVSLDALVRAMQAQGLTQEQIQAIVTTMAPPKPELPADAIRHKDAVAKFGLRKATLSDWVAAGRLQSWTVSHKERYVSESAVRRLVEGLRNGS